MALRRDPSHAAIFPWATCIAGIPAPNMFLFCSRETQYLGALPGSQFLLCWALCNLSCWEEAPCSGFYPSSLNCKTWPGKSVQHFPGAHPSRTMGKDSPSYASIHLRLPSQLPSAPFLSPLSPHPQTWLMWLSQLLGIQFCKMLPLRITVMVAPRATDLNGCSWSKAMFPTSVITKRSWQIGENERSKICGHIVTARIVVTTPLATLKPDNKSVSGFSSLCIGGKPPQGYL